MIYPSLGDIIEANYRLTSSVNGANQAYQNIPNLHSLKYLIYAVPRGWLSEIDEDNVDIYAQAAGYLYNIITRHIFSNGCKRTGFAVATSFLNLNVYHEKVNITAKDIVQFTLDVAESRLEFREIQIWFEDRFEN